MVLHTVILPVVDIQITEDKDFKNIEIKRPEILTPKEFLEKKVLNLKTIKPGSNKKVVGFNFYGVLNPQYKVLNNFD